MLCILLLLLKQLFVYCPVIFSNSFRHTDRQTDIQTDTQTHRQTEQHLLYAHVHTPQAIHPWLSCLQVRWADLEARKEEQRRREVGFCIGGQWGQVSEEEAHSILMGGKTEEKGQTEDS